MSSFEPPEGIDFDLGSLTVFDKRICFEDKEKHLTESVQAIVTMIFSLSAESAAGGRTFKLPDSLFPLPREKPIPKDRPLTKWEQFAKDKGLQQKKRDRLVLDEASGEYVPRYGRGSKNSLQKDVIIPHKQGMGDDFNPFADKKKQKKERTEANKKKQIANIRRSQKNQKSRITPLQSLDVAEVGPSGKKFLPKKALKDAFSVVQKSTASAGKFDKKVRKEPKQKSRGVKRKYETVVSKTGIVQEKERSQKIAARILASK